MEKQYIKIETTMSELMLAFLDTEEGTESFKKEMGEDWEQQLLLLRQKLKDNRKHIKEEKKIIITAEDKP